MTKYKPITQHELIQAILKQLPEINPLYVQKVITEQNRRFFVITDIAKYVKQFEIELYYERR